MLTITSVEIQQTGDSLFLKWEMPIQNRKLLWQHDVLDVRFYCDPFPDICGPAEILSSPFAPHEMAKGKSGGGGLNLAILGINSGVSSEVSYSTFQLNQQFKDNNGGFFRLTFQVLDGISLPDVTAGVVRVRWPLCTPITWKRETTAFRVVFDPAGEEFKPTYAAASEPDDKARPEPLPQVTFVPTPEMKARPRAQSRLFISYKRGTDGIQTLMNQLREAGYSLWFDRDDIHLGSSDWRADIEKGIWECAGMVLCLTPQACQSPPIRFEVKAALHFGKPIFPVMLEPLADIAAGLRAIGLPERYQVGNFTQVDQWRHEFQKLLLGLREHGLIVTSHDLRQRRNTAEHALHQRYLATVIERVGRLTLSAINPEHTDAEGAPLENIYVPLPTDMGLAVEVENYRVRDWWMRENRSKPVIHQPPYDGRDSRAIPEEERTRPTTKGWTDTAGLEQHIEGYQNWLNERLEYVRQLEAKNERFIPGRVEDGFDLKAIALDVLDAANACPRLVVLGGPGSGKSTFVKHLALCLAGAEREDWPRRDAANLKTLGRWSHGPLTPVYVELRAFVSSEHFPKTLEDMPTAAHLWAYIVHALLGTELEAYASILQNDLERGRALLILDGLDEVPYPRGKGHLETRQRQLKALASSLADQYGGTRILVASRPYAYAGWTLPGFEAVTVAPFSDAERTQLASNLFKESAYAAPTEKAKRLVAALRGVHPELKDTPLFITLMATVFALGKEEGLPNRTGALYRESILLLLERWTEAKPNAPSLTTLLGAAKRDDLLERLAVLAYDVHNQFGDQPGTPEIPRHLVAQHIFQMEMDEPTVKAAQLVAYLSESAGVLVSPGDKTGDPVFRFAHRAFQEYLAARHIKALCVADYAPTRTHMESRPQLWRVPCTLVDDVIVDEAGGDEAELWDYIDDLLPEKGAILLADDPRWWSVWLAGQAAWEHESLYTGKKLRGRDQFTLDYLREWLTKLVETSGALLPVERAACGRALGLLGDPRPGVGTMMVTLDGKPVELPQMEWCEIHAPPNGVFIMGADDQRDNPRRAVELKHGFKMGKYLITYQQFQTFVDSGEYGHEVWWEEFPPEYQLQPMDERNTPYANHPRDTVSWYQAVAFCRWLTVKYREAGLITHEAEIRLPTEQEWEYAARGTDERTYPYGNKFDATKGNTIETGIRQTSAVGLFPEGASPFGVLDLSGNVFEWCLNDHGNPEIIDGYRNGERKVLRGGSFLLNQNLAAASFRDHFSPPFGSYYYGVRLVVGAPMSAL